MASSMKNIHKKAFSVSFPATHRKINTQKLLRDVHAKNKKFDENAKIINDICVPLRKENKNFQHVNIHVVKFADVHTQFLENTEYAEFVLEN